MHQRVRRRSTNPFDDDFDDDNGSLSSPISRKSSMNLERKARSSGSNNHNDSKDVFHNDSNDVFHDCYDEENTSSSIKSPDEISLSQKKATKNATLIFNRKEEQEEKPALIFDDAWDSTNQSRRKPFTSPLESALSGMQENNNFDDSGVDMKRDKELLQNSEKCKLETIGSHTPTPPSLKKQQQESHWSKLVRIASSLVTSDHYDDENFRSQSSSSIHHLQGDLNNIGNSGEDDLLDMSNSSFISAKSNDSSSYVGTDDSLPSAALQQQPTTIPALLPEQNYHQQQRNIRAQAKGSMNEKEQPLYKNEPNESPVLQTLDLHVPKDSEFTLDYRSTGTPWSHLILLEDLGTASSWTVLLLPYAAFILCILLDTSSSLSVHHIGPLYAAPPCFATNKTRNSIISPVPSSSCSYQFAFDPRGSEQEKGGSNSNSNHTDDQLHHHQFENNHFSHFSGFFPNGTAFLSGTISEVPPMSSFLWGDVNFGNLSSGVVALVAQGHVISTTVIMQKVNDGAKGEDEDDYIWEPLSISNPQQLSMSCTINNDGGKDGNIHSQYVTLPSTWNCNSPRIIDVLFSEPGISVLTGEDLQIHVLYSFYKEPVIAELEKSLKFYNAFSLNDDDDDDEVSSGTIRERYSYVLTESFQAKNLLLDLNITQSRDKLIRSLVTSSAYNIQHERGFHFHLSSQVRLATLVITVCFTIFWCWSMGFQGFCCADSTATCYGDDDDDDEDEDGVGHDTENSPLTVKDRKKHKSILWWKSPWLLLPERRYLLVLLLCLLLVQNPLLAYAYFRRSLYGSTTMHAVSDALGGIGVHGLLFCWLCLFQGLRYHTASIFRKRAEQQRHLLELRKAAKYMSAADQNASYGTEHAISKYTADFYAQYGDIYGSVGDLHLRLKHDPCGDEWAVCCCCCFVLLYGLPFHRYCHLCYCWFLTLSPFFLGRPKNVETKDFLLRKVALLLLGVVSVIATAYCRFPAQRETAAPLTPKILHRYNAIYVFASFMQLLTLALWVLLIIRNSFLTATKLRKQPFLSTRPAQLAFRVLSGILFLGLGSVFVPFLIDVYRLIHKWYSGQENIQMNSTTSTLDFLLRVLVHLSSRFPYSGTSSSVGPGKVLYATVCALVAAFIFLPSISFLEDQGDTTKKRKNMIAGGNFLSSGMGDRARQRRDKRIVVTLARYTHTWRIFPLPLQKVDLLASELLAIGPFHLTQNFSLKYEKSIGRGVGYVGRYMPVFCVELACWLLEASWQSYYSPDEISTNDFAPGRMCLENIGLRLESAITDDSMETQAIIATNISSQVDGEEDSIIVIAFRGTSNATNVKTDFNYSQVPLPEPLVGRDDRPTFDVHADHIDAFNHDDFEDSLFNKFGQEPPPEEVHCFSPRNRKPSRPIQWRWRNRPSAFSSKVSSGAKAVIRATPMARRALPCVHKGFLEAYSNIRKQLWEIILPVLQRQFANAVSRSRSDVEESQEDSQPLVLPKIYLTGHSLGGSLAQLLALDLANNCELVLQVTQQKSFDTETEIFTLPVGSSMDNRDISISESRVDEEVPAEQPSKPMYLIPPIAVYTYGQPRLGNHSLSRLYKSKVPHTFRVVNEGDMTTSLPNLAVSGYVYKHAGLEVMLDEGCTGNILIGPTVVETLFRFTKVRTSVTAHSLERYRECLESSLAQDELQEYYKGHGSKGNYKAAMRSSRLQGNTSSLIGRQSTGAVPDWVTGKRGDYH